MTIKSVIQNYSKVKMAFTPTPIYKLSRLSSHLGHNIYIMRDDLTGFAIGGNKIRKLEYLIGDALKKKAQVLITSGATSFSRNAAAAGSAFGFDVHIFIVGDEAKQNSAGQVLFGLLDTKLHFIPEKKKETLVEEISKLKTLLEEKGQLVYELHPGGSDEIGTVSYINAFDEIIQFSRKNSIHFNTIIVTTGSAATQAGLVLGQCIEGYETTVLGMAIARPADFQKNRIQDLIERTAKMLGIRWDENKIMVDDRFIGPGYPLPSKESQEAMKIFASLEGVLLDAIYTGKSAAGLIHYASNGLFAKKDNILFIQSRIMLIL